MMDMTALAKWNAWNKEKASVLLLFFFSNFPNPDKISQGKTKEQAQLAYIDVVKKFKEKYGFSS